ncbi:hypothetical protein [Helicobacter sp. 11S02596-1]|uniref:hypothetical protein n=1 Tax=Helicobacter sp. 11S02596-1 TaxID=1476194 RepID=UPI000BA5C911|nr:hypothetical protein [Helicobacter sp. 11S02596-1]PAF43974.1 hypothetical protein BJI48_04100 [Helicobacter sp. 11S02596-1]
MRGVKTATYKLNQRVYDAIYENFPDKNQADVLVLAFQKVLGEQKEVVRESVNEKIDEIVFRVRTELVKEFATKSDLEAGLAKLELKILKQIGNIKEDLETKIDGFREDLETKIDGFREDLETKIDGFREDLETKIDGFREDLETKIDSVRTDLEEYKLYTERQFGLVRADIATLTSKVDGLSQGFDDKIRSFKYSILAWMGVGFVAIMGTIIGSVFSLVKFLMP